MGKYREILLIKPEIVRWLITSHGFDENSLGVFSKETGIAESRINEFVKGTKHPTWIEIENMSKVLGINPYLFYLKEEVDKFSSSRLLPKDYRRTYQNIDPNSLDERIVLSLATNKVRMMQESAKELMTLLKEGIEPDMPSGINRNHDPLAIAKDIRGASGISKGEQKSWENERVAFNKFREFLESKNILVFEIPLKSEITRGFSYADSYPFVIVVKHSDSPTGKTFTLFHEYAHLLLREGGVCGVDSIKNNISASGGLEAWCNTFAAEFLIPRGYLKEDLNGDLSFNVRLLSRLAKEYKVSREALLIKLRSIISINDVDFSREVEKCIIRNFKYKAGGISKEHEGRNLAKERITQLGSKFISLTNRNLKLNKITYRDALNFVDVKERVFEQIKNR